MEMTNTNQTISLGNGALVYKVEQDEGGQFGLTVACTMFGKKDEIFIPEISGDLKLMQNITEKMAENSVTPCTARDVIEDYITEVYS